jgi:hypothetical protein
MVQAAALVVESPSSSFSPWRDIVDAGMFADELGDQFMLNPNPPVPPKSAEVRLLPPPVFPTGDLGCRGARGAVGLGCRFAAYKQTLPSAPSRGWFGCMVKGYVR